MWILIIPYYFVVKALAEGTDVAWTGLRMFISCESIITGIHVNDPYRQWHHSEFRILWASVVSDNDCSVLCGCGARERTMPSFILSPSNRSIMDQIYNYARLMYVSTQKFACLVLQWIICGFVGFFIEKVVVALMPKKCPMFMEPKGSLQCSQKQDTCSKPLKSSSYTRTHIRRRLRICTSLQIYTLPWVGVNSLNSRSQPVKKNRNYLILSSLPRTSLLNITLKDVPSSMTSSAMVFLPSFISI
jgi:hypothetical protein